jgi:CheY-like chemotaxis protein
VLVADDVAANRMVARAMLAAAGHHVDSAADGTEAIAAVEREDYDVVLMDVQMPVMDGLEATRRIRGLGTSRARVPILAVTASALPDQVQACVEAGMDGHLAKPIDRESLLGAIRRLAAGGSAMPPIPAQDPEAEVPLLDASALGVLAADLGSSSRSVIEEFVGELRIGIATLSGEGIASDLPALRGAAHRLLGAARTLGARRLSRAIEALQDAVRAGRDPAEPLRLVLSVAAASLPAIEIAALARARRGTSAGRLLEQGVGD